MSIHRPWPDLAADRGSVVRLTPEDAGWTWTGLEVVTLSPVVPLVVESGESECFVLPLQGGVHVQVVHEGHTEATFDLAGRESVFTGASDFAYVGRDSTLVLTSDTAAEVSLPASRCEARLAPAYGAAADVPVEERGGGRALRHVRNFGVPGVWDHAEKLVSCEVLTPGGNWSSYPPHKHDASEPCPTVNEEIYYYRIAGRDGVTPSREGMGFHRTYTGPEHERADLAPIDESLDVRDHDVVLVPHGYHGPCVAAPDYPMYYLNVMAGPAAERSMAFCDDPEHAWIRDTWAPGGSTR